jgi:hypothetical protein
MEDRMSEQPERRLQTSIRIRESVWRALRDLAAVDRAEFSGRPSVSALVERLVEAEVERREGEHAER